jgi:hypothetical protein
LKDLAHSRLHPLGSDRGGTSRSVRILSALMLIPTC